MPTLVHLSSTVSFYGLGDATISDCTTDASVGLPVSRNFAFALPVRGDRNGLMVLSCDELPVRHDDSSGLELLNVLAARVILAFEQSGIDLIMGAPRRLGENLKHYVFASPSRPLWRWSGEFTGTTPFAFDLFVTTETHPAIDDHQDLPRLVNTLTEESTCSEPSSDS